MLLPRIRRFFWLAVFLVALGAAGSGVRAASSGGPPASPPTPLQKSLLLQMQDAFTRIAQTVEPCVVNIKAERLSPSASGDSDDGGKGDTPFAFPPGASRSPRRLQATGSGVIVRADGYILTNDHVVSGATGGVVTVTLADGREYAGRVFHDFRSDLAVVKIDPGTTPLPVAEFASSADVRPGQWAIAVGSPFDLQNTMTVGVVSAVGRHQEIPGEIPGERRYYPSLIQTDAAINPGNSGGPLFNIDGQVVGINVAIESPVEGSAGVGFAIPSDIAQQVTQSLIRDGKVVRGFLGLAPDDLTPALQDLYGQKEGAFVRDVQIESPAGKSGLQAGDIVTAFDGKPIRDEISFREAIAGSRPGATISIAYVRDGHSGIATVMMGAAPLAKDDEALPPSSSTIKNAGLGITTRDLTPRDRQSLALPPGTTGALIASVAAGSPAETASQAMGLVTLTGVVIQKVGRTTIHTKAEFNQAVAVLPSLSPVAIVILYSESGQLHQAALMLH